MKVAFDVDSTLVDAAHRPMHDSIALFRQLESFGCKMYIWSGGGVDYAKQTADRLNLEAEVVVKGSIEVDLAVDDQKVTLGKANLCVSIGEWNE